MTAVCCQDNYLSFLQIKQAVQFLHELGTVQHFDKELLRDRVVVNPQWIVDVMACLVSVHNKVVIVSILTV